MRRKLSTKTFIFSLLAITLIALAGIVILYLYLNVNPIRQYPSAIFNQPVTSERESITLSLSGPNDNSLVFNPDLLVSGMSSPGAIIVLNWNDNSRVIEAGPDGSFSQTIKLDSGINNIKVAAFDGSGIGREENRQIYYSTEKL